MSRKPLLAAFLLAAFLVLTVSDTALATEGFSSGMELYQGLNIDDSPNAQSGSGSESLLNNSKSREYYEKNRPGYGERFTAGIILGAVKWMMNLFHISDPVLLVFGKDPRANPGDDFLAGGVYGADARHEMVLGIFPEPFFRAVSVLYTAFERLLPIPLVVAVLVIAILFMLNSGTAEGRSKLKDYARAFVVAIVTLRFGHYLWIWFIEISNFLVDLIWAYMTENGVVKGFFMDMIWGTGRSGFEEAARIGALPMAILLFLAAIMVLVLNYQYTLRVIILGLLIAIFPVVAVLSVFPAFRHSLQMWAQEFIANVTIQLAHAVALGGFFIALATPGIGEGGTFWLMLAYFAGLPAIAALLRQLLGLSSGGGGVIAGIGSAMGVMAIANMARMLKARQTTVESRDIYMPASMAASGASVGSSYSGFAPSGGTSFQGKTSPGGFVPGTVAPKIARAGLGITAAAAGGALTGMMTGNPLPGAVAGMGAGSALGRKVENLAEGTTNFVKDAANIISSGGGIREVGESVLAKSMASGGAIANTNWALQSAVNKVSKTLGKGEVFAAPGFFEENKKIIHDSNKKMQDLKPQLDLACAKYMQAQATQKPGSAAYEAAMSNYRELKNQHDKYMADSLLAQARLRNYDELKKYAASVKNDTAAYSAKRGRL